jgi:hypothetical protein
MIKINKQLLLCAAILISLLLPAAVVKGRSISILPTAQTSRTICKDVNGIVKEGELDVLLLLDNSKSLSRSDERGQRFDAIDQLLESLAASERKNSKNNFGLITFGQSTKEIIGLKEITPNTYKSIGELIRDEVPNSLKDQEKLTDYVAALNEAFLILKSRPPSNCKFVIWFTDGVFDLSDSPNPINDKIDASKLQDAVCGESGLAKKFQSIPINTFVVFLDPGDTTNYEGRLRASQDAMQAITGDAEPNFYGESDRKVKEPCELGKHLGEVFPVDEAGKLKGFFRDFGPIANGGISITDDCPSIGGLVSKPLPNAEIIEWIAITSHTNEPPDLSKFDVLINGQQGKFLDYFEKLGASRQVSPYFEVKSDMRLKLAAGWKLKTDVSQSVCLFAKARDMKFRIRNGDTQIEVIEPKSLSKDLYTDNQLQLFDGENEIQIDEALALGSVSGKLTVESGEIFFKDSRIPVSIVLDGVFTISPSDCKLEIYYPEQVAPKGVVKSNDCDVIPAPRGGTIIDAEEALLSLKLSCPTFVWQLIANDQPVSEKWTVSTGDTKNNFYIATSASAPNEKLECKPTEKLAPVVVSVMNEKSQRVEIGVSVEYEFLKRVSSSRVAFITALFAILFMALSLAVLRLVNVLTAKGPSQSDFFGYEAEAELVPGDYKRGELHWPFMTTKTYVADPDKLHQIKDNPQRTSLDVGSLKFSRQLPPFTRPLQEARLVLRSKSAAVFWRANRYADGLPLAFGKALVISYTDDLPSNKEGSVRVKVTLLVPKHGSNAGIAGAQQLIRERGDEMASQLFAAGTAPGPNAIDKTEVKQEAQNNESPQRAQIDGPAVVPEIKRKPPEPPRSPQPPQPPQRSN